jgi:hypothetical protein
MLNKEQRRENYAYQPVAIGGFDSAKRDWQPTPAQTRRIRKKANKAKGDAPRSRKQRWLTNLQAAIENRRNLNEEIERRRVEREKVNPLDILSTVDDTAGEVFPNEYIAVADKDGNPIDDAEEAPEGKPLCPTCEPVAPDWACRTKSGKKTRDHAGRMR